MKPEAFLLTYLAWIHNHLRALLSVRDDVLFCSSFQWWKRWSLSGVFMYTPCSSCSDLERAPAAPRCTAHLQKSDSDCLHILWATSSWPFINVGTKTKLNKTKKTQKTSNPCEPKAQKSECSMCLVLLFARGSQSRERWLKGGGAKVSCWCRGWGEGLHEA